MTGDQVATVAMMLCAAALILGMAMSGFGSIRRKAVFQVSKVRWFRTPSNRPAIYIMKSKSNPKMFKVGYTSRRVEARAAEISAARGPVEIVAWVRMPHAYVVEQRVHARLKGTWRVKDLGNEWYLVKNRKPEDLLKKVICSETRKVRILARMKFAWPEDGRIRWG